MAETFFDALANLEQLLQRTALYDDDVVSNLRTVEKNRPLELTHPQLWRLMGLCYRLIGAQGPDVHLLARHENTRAFNQTDWIARQLIEDTFMDRGARRNRDWIEGRRAWSLALDNDIYVDFGENYIPHYSAPITQSQAADLTAPYFAHLETHLAQQPLCILKLCWEVFEYPMPPFLQVFRDWLSDLDARQMGHGPYLAAIDRAMALDRLTRENAQRVTWEDIETKFLPQLRDAHPLVAGNLAKFIGSLYADYVDGGGRIMKGSPWPVPKILDYIAELPQNRRAVAGGFLDYNGFSADNDPFGELAKIEGLTKATIDDWVLKIFAEDGPEPYLPGAQSFWFPVHESYWNDAAFAMRLIDADHIWEALVCATEAPLDKNSMMEPVLHRLINTNDPHIAQAAQNALKHISR